MIKSFGMISPLLLLVIDIESQRLHQVQRDPGRGSGPCHISCVLRYLRMDQHQVQVLPMRVIAITCTVMSTGLNNYAQITPRSR